MMNVRMKSRLKVTGAQPENLLGQDRLLGMEAFQ